MYNNLKEMGKFLFITTPYSVFIKTPYWLAVNIGLPYIKYSAIDKLYVPALKKTLLSCASTLKENDFTVKSDLISNISSYIPDESLLDIYFPAYIFDAMVCDGMVNSFINYYIPKSITKVGMPILGASLVKEVLEYYQWSTIISQTEYKKNVLNIIGNASDLGFSRAISYAGDFNADGKADIIIGDHKDSNYAVIFGKEDKQTINIKNMNKIQGFTIKGDANNGAHGQGVSYIGDFNADGFDDLAIGSSYSSSPINTTETAIFFKNLGLEGFSFPSNKIQAGVVNIVFGNSEGVYEESLKILGANPGDHTGANVRFAGDVNGDGIADIIIGADEATVSTYNISNNIIEEDHLKKYCYQFSDLAFDSTSIVTKNVTFKDLLTEAKATFSSGTGVGVTFLVYGKKGGYNTSIDLYDLNAAQGVKIIGEYTHGLLGFGVDAAGDVNDDGVDDIIISAFGDLQQKSDLNGIVYVIYGKKGGLLNFNVAHLKPQDGFKITGEKKGDHIGTVVRKAGDINGDGIDDIIISSPIVQNDNGSKGAVYVIFGKHAINRGNIDLKNLTINKDGFKIASDRLAPSATFAESVDVLDLNGDGINDIISSHSDVIPSTLFDALLYLIKWPLNTLQHKSIFVLFGINATTEQYEVDPANLLTFPILARGPIRVAAINDFDNDGIPDIAVTIPGTALVKFLTQIPQLFMSMITFGTYNENPLDNFYVYNDEVKIFSGIDTLNELCPTGWECPE